MKKKVEKVEEIQKEEPIEIREIIGECCDGEFLKVITKDGSMKIIEKRLIEE